MDPARLTRAAVALAVGVVALTVAGCDDLGRDQVGGSPRSEHGSVSWVVDGDTLRLADGRVVRLVQIDAPEAHGDCFGRDATRALVRLAPKGTAVRLERDPRLDDRDAYDRLLRYVLVAGANVNVALVREGAAEPYFFRNERGHLARELLAAAHAARAHGRGLWGVCPDARLVPGLGAVTGAASTQRR